MTELTPLSTLTINANVGMDEVVSVFVARYEDQLFAKKEELSDHMRKLKKQRSDLEKHLIEAVDLTPYNNITVPLLNLVGFVKDDPCVVWDESYHYSKNSVGICVTLQTANGTTKSHYPVSFPISEENIKQKCDLDAEIEAVYTELLEVMNQIKSIGRKERQVRGKISELKLAECGHIELLNNPELLKLIAIS